MSVHFKNIPPRHNLRQFKTGTDSRTLHPYALVSPASFVIAIRALPQENCTVYPVGSDILVASSPHALTDLGAPVCV